MHKLYMKSMQNLMIFSYEVDFHETGVCTRIQGNLQRKGDIFSYKYGGCRFSMALAKSNRSAKVKDSCVSQP